MNRFLNFLLFPHHNKAMSIPLQLITHSHRDNSCHKTSLNPSSTSSSESSFHTLLPPRHPRNLVVHHPYDCPNLFCKIPITHIHSNLCPPPPDIPTYTVRILRFNPTSNPFPERNCWQVTEKPWIMLQHNLVILVERYGWVKLWHLDGEDEQVEEGEVQKWIFFRCRNMDGIAVADIVIKKAWLDPLAERRGQNPRKSRFNLWSFLPCLH